MNNLQVMDKKMGLVQEIILNTYAQVHTKMDANNSQECDSLTLARREIIYQHIQAIVLTKHLGKIRYMESIQAAA